MNILLVSSDYPFANVLGFGLSLKGMGVLIAKSYEEAKAIVSNAIGKIDAMVVDYLLNGDKNGLDLVWDLKKDTPNIPKILITPIKEERLFKEARSIGCNGILCKPVTVDEILSQIKNQGVDRCT